MNLEFLVSRASDSAVETCHNVDFITCIYSLDVNVSLNHFFHCDPI